MSTDDRKPKRKTPQPGPMNTITTTSSSNQSGSNDFVKKLFLMLEEDSYKDIVRWTHTGDSFVVLNTNEFTKEILPRHFKHSNFASFVRQLNKYDFHKVKISNEERATYPYGDDTWEFKHPDFRQNDRESLDNIKRKGPTSKKATPGASSASATTSQVINGVDAAALARCNHNYTQMLTSQNQLKDQMESLRQENKQLQQEINILTRKYKTLVENIVAINTVDERSHRSMGILVNCLIQAGIKIPPLDFPPPQSLQGEVNNSEFGSSLPSLSSHLLNHNTSPQQALPPGAAPPNALPQHPQQSILPPHLANPPPPPPPHLQPAIQLPQPPTNGNQPPYIAATPTAQAIPSPGAIPQMQGPAMVPQPQAVPQPPQQQVPPISAATAPNATATTANPVAVATSISRLASSQEGSKSHSQTTSTSASPLVPGAGGLPLAVPGPTEVSATTTTVPNAKFHVLLVEDDNVCIQLCRKFLVKYGCQVTVVTDGLNAISTVEHTKYDLVLMDIVMPNLDGATATSVIRSFDTKTPIIAMTGNIEDNDLVTYLQNGMSDILAKPFTKDDLYSILAKHLLTDKSEGAAVSTGLSESALKGAIKSEDDQIVKKPRLI
ncbi:uncharacterized protein SPAPADRAFT_61025 [Spathaspora passalidarum NRRL Y-27907]|uniref:Transcription factor n=1 Tax=Spathaspora passalidarum (strain NRRL Y-27907 / 11-Y1) TaxID=619300 RepID=G3AN79_SPAPN|nr:uncharacterized protein SPAPADRAFT_61025 [Spathaspora passalidarum NRRL Y-27907]EGW31922.1 hypothetical protein SPAPADRAFT_61025 [Spathaspora passalidarum NRRL Y-27907]